MSKRKGIMLCYPFEEKRLLKWNPPYIVQPKLDGVRCRAVPRDSMFQQLGYMLLSSECHEITGVPHIVKALNTSGMWPQELDGELYRHGMSFEDIFSITSRTVALNPNYDTMQYHVFDFVMNKPQFQRMPQNYIKKTFFDIIQPVEFYLCNNLDEVLKTYDKILESGYEGIIVRNIDGTYLRRRSTSIMKFKPKKDDYYIITGYKEEISIDGFPKGRLGVLECASGDGNTFTVGSGLNDYLRGSLWAKRESLIGKLCHVQYQHITPGRGVPRFPVFMEVIDAEPKEVGLKV